jgi:phosphoribosylamine-glycine ligase
MAKLTKIITFGYDEEDSVPEADQVFDVRDEPDEPPGDYSEQWEKRAQEIFDAITPGETIAIGCREGEDRSVHIAEMVKQLLGGKATVIDEEPQKKSEAQVAEDIRKGRNSGMSERDAILKAYKGSSDDSEEAEPAHSSEADPEPSGDSDRQWVIVTKDFSGLGWAKKLIEEGETVTVASIEDEDDAETKKQRAQVGKGWVGVIELSKAISSLSTDNTYWVFTENNYPEEADKLRKAGQKVFGTSALSEKMEHDRNYGVEVANEAGLDSPPTHEFTSLEEGITYIEENPDTAYVFKPDDGKFNYMTFVPIRKKDADANREVFHYLSHMKEDPGPYILQERIPQEDALEVCVEAWMYEGEPFMATLGLEVKRKNTYDLGEMCGCGGDFSQIIPLDSELVKQTVGKMFPFYKEQNYTGFVDVNVLFTPDNKPHFLEVCNRFGYNAHPNLFLGLALDGFGNILADYIDGYVDNMESRFRKDIGCSLTLFLDHPRPGLPVHIDERFNEQFYPFDGYKENDDDTLLLTGYSDEVGVFIDHGATIEAAWKAVSEKIAFEEAVSFPDMYYRWDLAADNYFNAPILRYKELHKRGLL